MDGKEICRWLIACVLLATGSTGAGAAGAPDWMTGVNLSDGALNSSRTRLHFDYTYPTAAEIDYFADKGFKVLRVPLLSKRILTPEGGERNPDWGILAGLIAHANVRGLSVLLDLHQYGKMPSGLVGRDAAATQEFVAFWTAVATRLKGQPNVLFGLMNEPNVQSPQEWLSGANAAIAAIRQAGARQLVLVPGSSWDGALNWTRSRNGEVMGGVDDPGHNFVYEVHQYLDKNSSGTTSDVEVGSGAGSLVAFTQWARARRVKGFLGEFGFAATPDAMAEGQDLLRYMADNKDVWRGWTYWAAGQWWGTYAFSVEPGKDGTDKPQMQVLLQHR